MADTAGERGGDGSAPADLVASLQAFLRAWGGEADDEAQRRGSSSVGAKIRSNSNSNSGSLPGGTTGAPSPATAAAAAAYLRGFPPRLPAPLPRSFRPNEMVPGLYLGSYADIGTDMVELARRLCRATAGSTPASSSPTSPFTESGPTAALGGAARVPPPQQQLVLVVRVCPTKGVVAPRLELHAATAPPRREPGALSRRPRPAVGGSAARAPARAAAGPTASAEPAADPLLHLSLADAYKRVCAAVAAAADVSMETDREGEEREEATADGVGEEEARCVSARRAIATWLSPDSPQSSPSRKPSSVLRQSGAAAEVPAGCIPADWAAYVAAMQALLLREATAAAAEAAAATPPADAAPPRPFLYWRLTVPILDAPGVRMAHYTPMTTLLLHAALGLAAEAPGQAWLQERHRRTHISDATSTAGEATAAAAAAAVGVAPCVAVHCQAGKSRSVTFVAAFLLQEWMWWYRGGTHVSHRTELSPRPHTQQQQHDKIARRLVDVVLNYLRNRRLCIDINLGFDAQLWQMACAFVRGLE